MLSFVDLCRQRLIIGRQGQIDRHLCRFDRSIKLTGRCIRGRERIKNLGLPVVRQLGRPLGQLHRLLWLALLRIGRGGKDSRQKIQRLGRVRCQVYRLANSRDRFVGGSRHSQSNAEPVLRLGLVVTLLQRQAEVRDRLIESSLLNPGLAHEPMGQCMIGLNLKDLLIMVDRPIQITLTPEQFRQLKAGFDILRLNPQCLTIVDDRLVKLFLL